jgi:protein tyrosine phosphatase type 4A
MAAKRTIPQTKPLSLVEYHNLSFLIFDAPSDATIDRYIAEFKKHAITNIIRCCEITYDKTALNNVGITVHV